MPRDGTTGVFTRVSNSFSNPIVGSTIDPTAADAHFDDVDSGISGSVACPVSSTDNAIMRFDGATGKFSQNSVVTVSDTGVVAGSSISGSTNTLSAVALSSLASQSANTLVGNFTGSSAAPTATNPSALTHKASPTTSDILLLTDVAASNTLKYATISEVVGAIGSGVTSLNGQTGAIVHLIAPGGRITLTTAVPVLTSTVSGATTVYYSPYIHNQIMIYDGTNFIPTTFSELSQATTDSTKSPAAVANNKNYDIFVWNDSGTIRATRGPAWSSDTSRGTGAGTSELTRVNGVLLNANSITNGPAASRGTYVGTIRSNGSAAIDWIYGAVAANGTAASFGVWNCFNRILITSITGDSTDSYSVTAAGSPKAANSSNTMRCSFVSGLAEDAFTAKYNAYATAGTSGNCSSGIGYDSTSAFLSGSQIAFTNNTANIAQLAGEYTTTALGFHFFQAMESASTATATFYGDGGAPTIAQNGLTCTLRM